MKRKGQAALYITFMLAAIFMLMIVAVFAPLGVRMNTAFYEAGEDIILGSAPDIANIEDATTRGQINATIYEAIGETQNNIEINASLFQYGWVIIIILGAIIVFLNARTLVEFRGGGIA